MIKSDLIGNKAKLLNDCYNAIRCAEDNLINEVYEYAKKHYDIEETCDVPTLINTIVIYPSSILDSLTINGKLCTDLDKA